MSRLSIVNYQSEHLPVLKGISEVAYADPVRGWGQEGYDVGCTLQRFADGGRTLVGATLIEDGILPVGGALATIVPHEQIEEFVFGETVSIAQGVENLNEPARMALRDSLKKLVDYKIPGACNLFGEIFTRRDKGRRSDTVRLWKAIMSGAVSRSDLTIGITKNGSSMDGMIRRSLANWINGDLFHQTNVMNFYAVPHDDNPNLHLFINAPDLLTNLLVK